MIEIIIDQMADAVDTLPFVTKVGGLVRMQKMMVGEKEKTLPVTSRGAATNAYELLAPDSKEACIVYFESNPTARVRSLSNGSHVMAARVRMVTWMNLARLNPANFAQVQTACVASVLKKYANVGNIRNISVSPYAEVEQSASIFSRFNYNESELQMFMLPYNYFAFDFDVNFIFAPECEPVTISLIEPCC